MPNPWMIAVLAIDLQIFAQAPSAELTSLMIAKETVFGTAATPTTTMIPDSVSFTGTNETLERPGATKAVGQNDEPVGMFMGKWNVSAEADPDTIGAWFLLAMGSESYAAASGNPTASGTTTLSAASAVAATTFTLTSTSGFVSGCGFRIDAGLPTQEDFIQTGAPSGQVVTVTTAAKYAHASGAAVAPCTLGYTHTYTLASPRLSFTAQRNLVNGSFNYMGCKVGTLDLSMTPKAILSAKISGPYANEAYVSSPTSPTYSTINPEIFEQTANLVTINGIAADATVQSFQTSIATGVVTDYPKYGNGRIAYIFPEQKTVVSLKLTLAFETMTQLYNFWGGQNVTGPQSTVPSLPNTSIVCNSPDAINAGVQYGFTLTFGKVKFVTAPLDTKAKSYITQQVSAKVYMATRGANNDVSIALNNATNAASL